MSGIFLNYRRGDEPGFTGRLYDRLEAEFEAKQIFMDVDSIPAGLDFVRMLEEAVDRCDILLAVIGKSWLQASDATGTRRLDNPEDFVRIEIETGLKLGKRVIPVLVNNAEMPRADDLPEGLKQLARRNAVRLTHDRFRSDAQGLIKVLQSSLADAEKLRANTAEAEEARRKVEEEQARAAIAEKESQDRERQLIEAGLSLAEVQKAEEIANWNAIKGTANPDRLRNHLARFPEGSKQKEARARLEELAWTKLGASPKLNELEDYLAEFSHGAHAPAASEKLQVRLSEVKAAEESEANRRRESEAWFKATASDTHVAYGDYLREYPTGASVSAAISRIESLNQKAFRRTFLKASLLGSIAITAYFFVRASGGASHILSNDFTPDQGTVRNSLSQLVTSSRDDCFQECRKREECSGVTFNAPANGTYNDARGLCMVFSRWSFTRTSNGRQVFMRKQ